MTYIANDIYERMEADEENLGGSVQEDLDQFNGNFRDMEDYFGDQDPTLFL
jgi:hypothetical protein